MDMNTYADASYFQFLNGALIYTNLPGFNKNWLWRGDNPWFGRWLEIQYWQPEWVEIITWNDYVPPHWTLVDKAMDLFTRDQAPYNYAANLPHDGWRKLLPFSIDMYKQGSATISEETVVFCDSGTSGNTASQLQIEFAAADVMQDRIFYAAQLTSPASVTVSIGGVSQAGTWSDMPAGNGGLYHGSVPFSGQLGQVVITITCGGRVVTEGTGRAITTSCTNGLVNWNAWVGQGSSRSVAATTVSSAGWVCIEGTGSYNFAGLCSFACQYAYCLQGACVCTKMNPAKPRPTPLNVQGYPAAGLDENCSGLCAFNCNYGYCPAGACATTPGPLTTPTVSPFLPPACTSGTGSENFAGLCSYACNFGFCPRAVCTCTGQGGLNLPPWTLPTPTTITFPPFTTTVTESWFAGDFSVTTVTVTFPPLTTDKIPVYNLNITTAGVSSATYTVSPSTIRSGTITINPPSGYEFPPATITVTSNPPDTTATFPTITGTFPTFSFTSALPPGPTCTSGCGSQCQSNCGSCGIECICYWCVPPPLGGCPLPPPICAGPICPIPPPIPDDDCDSADTTTVTRCTVSCSVTKKASEPTLSTTCTSTTCSQRLGCGLTDSTTTTRTTFGCSATSGPSIPGGPTSISRCPRLATPPGSPRPTPPAPTLTSCRAQPPPPTAGGNTRALYSFMFWSEAGQATIRGCNFAQQPGFRYFPTLTGVGVYGDNTCTFDKASMTLSCTQWADATCSDDPDVILTVGGTCQSFQNYKPSCFVTGGIFDLNTILLVLVE
ncbi:glycosyl hydrolase family 71-domain-containing protein [Podospora didyma]|uniref:Glycosyl hydrolase family 71-domain-containing protein n=1 Tax=Podospora didyma TaxID=330526 RepID=A0AAE0N956_9PEZI|nr:glycosyl hydrolase family 71-domain-containing protein [Podospora didyma]